MPPLPSEEQLPLRCNPSLWSWNPVFHSIWRLLTFSSHRPADHLRDRPLTIFVTTWPLRFARADALFRLRALLPSSPLWSNTPSIYTKHVYQYSEIATGRRKRKGRTRRLCANFASFISKRSTPTFAFLQTHHLGRVQELWVVVQGNSTHQYIHSSTSSKVIHWYGAQ